MSLNFLPGEPNPTPDSCCFVNWNTIQILTYTSGNNLVILTKNSTHLQTIYLSQDSFAVDVNKVNGKIAIAIGNEVHIYTPEVSNYYNFNFHGRKNIDELKIQWMKEHVIVNEKDPSEISCLSWSDYTEIPDSDLESQFMDLPPEFNSKTTCELITGSAKSLTMHKLTYITEDGEKKIQCQLLWYKEQPNPIYKVKFSPNATCIASIGYYDKNVKLWHRVGFTSEFSDFEPYYISHDTYVTDIIWKSQMSEYDPNNQNSSKVGSAQLTPSHSFVLKPANSIIKNDTTFLNETNSVYSISKKERQHNVLYSVTEDSILRVHSTFRLDKGFMIYDSGSLDLFDGNVEERKRGIITSVAFIDNPYLELGLEKLISDMELEHGNLDVTTSTRKQGKILEFINSKSELGMVVSSDGALRLYALSNLCSAYPAKMVVSKLNKIQLKGETCLASLKLSPYCLPSIPKSFYLKSIQINHYSKDMALSLAVHDAFHNTIREVGFTFEELFALEKSRSTPNGKSYRTAQVNVGTLKQKFTGHQKSVRKLIRASDGSSILSVTRFNENYLWIPIYLSKKRTTLTKKSIIVTPSPIIDAVIWNNGDFVFAVAENKLLAYQCFRSEKRNLPAREIGNIEFDTSSSPESFFLLPESSREKCHIVAVFKDGSCKSVEFEIQSVDGHNKYTLTPCHIEELPRRENNDLHIIDAIDPVGWTKSIDRIGRDVLATVSSTGLVSIYYATFDDMEDHLIKWHLKDSFRTGIKNCSFISCSSINKMAIVDEKRNTLSIWDMKVGVMDYSETFEDETVKDVDWTSTIYEQGILSVGFASHALLFTQLRYDYTNRSSSFAKIKKVDISMDTEHQIGDSIWMEDGLLVIGAGNQLYLSDKRLDINNDLVTNQAIGTLEIVSNDLMHLSSALNGPLPLYHPQFIIQLLLSGRSYLIASILAKLTKVLREIDLGQRDENDFDLKLTTGELMSDEISDNKQRRYSSLLDERQNEGDVDDEFDEQCADILVEKLQKIRLPFLTGHQQITLSHTVSIMKDVLLKYRKVLDFNGLKFYLTMKLFKVNSSKDSKNESISTIRMRDISFALHSDNRDMLYNIVNEQSGMKMDWKHAKRYLLSFWLGRHKLMQVMERVAANEFLKFQDENDGRKDPSSCSIIYLALKKKKVLLGLWKNSIGHPERTKMVRFLSNDFTEERWKSAALKNAFVLLGKHRYLDAATFFLLADSPKDAVNVIMKQLEDIPLAIAVARCYEDRDDGPSMKTIFERKMLLEAITSNDRWKISWIFWILGDKPHAAQSLIKPLKKIKDDIATVLPDFKWPNIESVVRTSNTEDPVLLVMYDSLRNRNVEYNRGISSLHSRDEFSFIVKASTMYMKMGCDWLALYLVRKWKFSKHKSRSKTISYDVPNALSETAESQQRKKPGDILAKFMTPASSPSSSSSTSTSTVNLQPNNLLDSYNMGSVSNMDESFAGKRPNLLDSFGSARGTRNMLDDFADTSMSSSSSAPKQQKPSNLLDSFSAPVYASPASVPAPVPTPQPKKPVSGNGSAPNMLDAWS